jgi:hypothetical protein
MLAAVGTDQRFSLWDVRTGREQRQQQINWRSFDALPPRDSDRPRPHQAAVATDGRTIAMLWLAWAAGVDSVALWDAAWSRELVVLPRQQGFTSTMALSPDGKILATGSHQSKLHNNVMVRPSDPIITLWEVATGKELLTLKGLADTTSAIAFSADGRYLAAAGSYPQPAIHVFEVRTGQEILKLLGHAAYVSALAFSPDGRRLATAQRDTTALVWDLAPAIPAAKPAASALEPNDLIELWTDLASDEASKAHTAIWSLITVPQQAVPLLRDRLQPAAGIPAEQLRQLLADLESDQFQRREAASKKLAALEEQAEPALAAKLKANPTLELRRRIETLLATPRIVRSPEALRHLRAVQVLEQIGSLEARTVLTNLTKGAPAARLTQQAKAALDRLARRPTTTP